VVGTVIRWTLLSLLPGNATDPAAREAERAVAYLTDSIRLIKT